MHTAQDQSQSLPLANSQPGHFSTFPCMNTLDLSHNPQPHPNWLVEWEWLHQHELSPTNNIGHVRNTKLLIPLHTLQIHPNPALKALGERSGTTSESPDVESKNPITNSSAKRSAVPMIPERISPVPGHEPWLDRKLHCIEHLSTIITELNGIMEFCFLEPNWTELSWGGSVRFGLSEMVFGFGSNWVTFDSWWRDSRLGVLFAWTWQCSVEPCSSDG